MEYIANNYTNGDINIAFLAELSEMSEVHFRRLFREVYFISPKKYIIMLRINRAKELLHYNDQSITRIAETLGFDYVYYFCRVFKNETGLTPTEYKKSLNSNFHL